MERGSRPAIPRGFELDENSVTQHFYISTESAPADDRTRVLKHGKTFAVFDHYGDITVVGLKEQGVFCEGTRFLSQLEFQLAQARPLLLSSTVKADNSLFAADLTNVDILRNGEVVVPRGTLHVLRTKFLWHGACYEQFRVVNYGPVPVDLPFRLRFAADFADIFEVRGVTRPKRGTRLSDVVDENSVTLTYQGLDDVIRRTRLSCTPRPRKISASEIHFNACLEPRTQITFELTTSCEILPHSNGVPRGYRARGLPPKARSRKSGGSPAKSTLQATNSMAGSRVRNRTLK